jgi:hypothetical protein
MQNTNFRKYFDEYDELRLPAEGEDLWLKYLTETGHVYVNAERMESVEHISSHETVMYVMRTLDVLDDIFSQTEDLPCERSVRYLLSTVLKWSEVAKGGNKRERSKWTKAGYPLDIHNIASACIFEEATQELRSAYNECFGEDTEYFLELTAKLIRTHGLIGQCIRGEIPVAHNRELYLIAQDERFRKLTSGLDRNSDNSGGTDDAKRFFMILNECIIRGVSDKIWENVKGEAEALIGRVLSGDVSEYSAKYRLENLCPKEINIFDEDAEFFESEIFPKYELWYFTSALSDFDLGQIKTIFTYALDAISKSKEAVYHINLKPLADTLYYDYENKKHVNVYKKRIIEKYLKEPSTQHVQPEIKILNGTAFVNFVFTPVCVKLIDFCVEAERSGLLTYEKSIIVLYDMFGFRRDAFDRLNNEEKYLSTMNDVNTSTKDTIIDYSVGMRIVDVGSGGGVLLDRLEKKFPDREIIGTDISTNVIDALNAKKKKEGHRWNVVAHNFVEGPFANKTDTVIFSSILHEIYSYTETPRGRFEIDSVKTALKNAFASLTPGGRIIIRDGIKTDSDELVTIRFKSSDGMEFFENYRNDFKGLKDIPDEKKVVFADARSLTVTGDINFMREFMYTYTWGKQSYAHEVQEQFGYFTLKEYTDYLRGLGAKIIVARELLESGYPLNLGKYLDLMDQNGNERVYPASNCIIVAEC